MPITHEIERIDENRVLIRTTCFGPVDFEQVIEHFKTVEADPDRPELIDVLLDLCDVTTLPDRNQVKSVAAEVGRMLPALNWGNLAVVASRDVVFGVSRMFEMLSQSHFDATNVFRTREDAEAWMVAARE
jgi:hypothetical protein